MFPYFKAITNTSFYPDLLILKEDKLPGFNYSWAENHHQQAII